MKSVVDSYWLGMSDEFTIQGWSFSYLSFSPWYSFCEDGGAVFCVALLVLSSS